ncbi:hypothetical protein KHC28_00835 [Ancylobacter sonchi]|uniref:hypothetical protein n=1 Tax=Ancylobacter sonchi TaxID=1937790 RepID=UPI001BD2181A|nr:hypothetical protein [Ancylobacter sonchi]MBS7532209.1 hypothetical protein [Ancylobacter sonchi]
MPDIYEDLANSTDATKGAGLVAYNSALAYAPGTVGGALLDQARNYQYTLSLADFTTPDDDDSAPGLNAFAAELIANGGHGFIPAGVYKIKTKWRIYSSGSGNAPFSITFSDGAVINGYFESDDNFIEFRELSDFTINGLQLNGRASVTAQGSHGVVVRNCSNWRFGGATHITDWAATGGSAGFMAYTPVPDNLGTYRHGLIEDLSVIAGPQGAGIGCLIHEMWYVDVMKVYAKDIRNGIGYGIQFKDGNRFCKYHAWRCENCTYAVAFGREADWGATDSHFGSGEAINCLNFLGSSKTTNCSVGLSQITVDSARVDVTSKRFIMLSGGTTGMKVHGVAIVGYPSTNTYPIYINPGSDRNYIRVISISGATKYWEVSDSDYNTVIIERDFSRTTTPNLDEYGINTGAGNFFEAGGVSAQWKSAAGTLQFRGNQVGSPNANELTLGTSSTPWQRLYAQTVSADRLDLASLDEVPTTSPADGDIAFSNGTVGANGWGGYGRGLYMYNATDAIWEYVSGPRGIVVAGQSSVSVNLTGTTVQTVLATINIPANTLKPNDSIRVTSLWSHDNSSNSKNMRVRFGPEYFSNVSATTSSSSRLQVQIYNRERDTEFHQVAAAPALSAFGASSVGVLTQSVSTNVDRSVTLTGQLASADGSITLEAYTVEVIRV